jgi:hypothetical protein
MRLIDVCTIKRQKKNEVINNKNLFELKANGTDELRRDERGSLSRQRHHLIHVTGTETDHHTVCKHQEGKGKRDDRMSKMTNDDEHELSEMSIWDKTVCPLMYLCLRR